MKKTPDTRAEKSGLNNKKKIKFIKYLLFNFYFNNSQEL